MKSIKKSTTHPLRTKFIIVAVVVLLGGAYALAASAMRLWPFNTSSSQQSIESDSNDKNKNSQDNANDKTNSTDSNNTTNNAKNTNSDATSNSQSGTVIISAATQDGNMLRLRAFIPSVESSGNCTLTLTKDTTKLTFTAGIQPGPSSSTCQGFDISISEQQITAGKWTASVSVVAGSTNTSASQEVTIQ